MIRYKVPLCENCQRQSCKAFIGLTIRAKIIGVGQPLLSEILGQTDRVGGKSAFGELHVQMPARNVLLLMIKTKFRNVEIFG